MKTRLSDLGGGSAVYLHLFQAFVNGKKMSVSTAQSRTCRPGGPCKQGCFRVFLLRAYILYWIQGLELKSSTPLLINPFERILTCFSMPPLTGG